MGFLSYSTLRNLLINNTFYRTLGWLVLQDNNLTIVFTVFPLLYLADYFYFCA